MWHISIMPIIVWLSGPEYYFPQFFIVMFPEKLPTFLFVCSWFF